MQKKQSGLTMTPTMWLYVDDLRRTGLYGDVRELFAPPVPEGGE